tara:strand:+ start:408 stop:722 length:315 start_codon:yes stop_codon:yes gene_type:complete
MPTKYTKCDECNYHDYLPVDHIMNKNYLEDLKLAEILKNNLPDELVIKILNLRKLQACNYCQKWTFKKNSLLCQKHYNRACHNSKQFRGDINKAMCSDCCWNCV